MQLNNDSKETGSEVPPHVPDHDLLRCIGRGAYGVVWLARSSLDVYRAVKIVYRRPLSDNRSFERELSGVRAFEPISRSHEGFVDLLHFGMNEERGYCYYVMELGDDLNTGQMIDPATYIPKTLQQEIATHGPLSASECLNVGLALSLALDYLHSEGLVHRDIKPANIIFVDGIPKLADVGLVAEVGEAQSIVGTVGFFPPEGPGTPQADVYGLGKALYEASTGNDRKEFPDFPTSIDQVSEWQEFIELNEVIVRACNPYPGSRYASARDMHADLMTLADGKSLRCRRLLRQRLIRVARVAAGVLAGTAIVLSAVYLMTHERKVAAEARERAVRASVTDGVRAMNGGDFLGALPHFTEALRLDSADPHRTAVQRLRLGSILDQCPKLTHLWAGEEPVVGSQFSGDGTQVLLARYFGNAEVYDLRSGRLRVLKPPPTLINAAYSHDGRRMVTVSQSSVACVWDSVSFSEIRRFPHPTQVWNARFSPDGLHLATAASDGLARVWDLKTGLLNFVLKHADTVGFCDFSHDGRLIVTASHDGTAQLWSAENGQPVGAPLKHGGWVTCAAFSPNDQRIVTGSLDRKAQIWETKSGHKVPPDLEHRDAVQSAEFSPDGRFILTGSSDGNVCLWTAEDQQPADRNPVLHHSAPVTGASFSSDGRRILTACADGSARIWDLAGSSGEPVFEPRGFSADGRRFLAIESNEVQVCDTPSGHKVGSPVKFIPPLQKAVLSSGGDFLTIYRLAAGSSNHLIQVWDVAGAKVLGPEMSLSKAPTDMSLDGQGKRLVVCDGDRVQTWDVSKGTPLSPVLRQKQPISRSIFSRTGKRVATLSGAEVRVWDSYNGRAIFTPLTLSQPARVAEFSPDDAYLAVGCSDNLRTACYAQVYSATTGHPVSGPVNHGAGVLSVSFSRDRHRLVTGSADFTAMVWDVSAGHRLGAPLQHGNQVRDAEFSPDGRWIVTASADRTARVWDAESGEPVTPAFHSAVPLARAVFLDEHGHILTIDEQGEGRIWILRPEPRPVPVLLSLVHALTGVKANGSAVEPLDVLWRRLRAQYPDDFAASASTIGAWHEYSAEEAEVHGQWLTAAFHLEHVRLLHPDDLRLTARLASAREHVQNRN